MFQRLIFFIECRRSVFLVFFFKLFFFFHFFVFHFLFPTFRWYKASNGLYSFTKGIFLVSFSLENSLYLAFFSLTEAYLLVKCIADSWMFRCWFVVRFVWWQSFIQTRWTFWGTSSFLYPLSILWSFTSFFSFLSLLWKQQHVFLGNDHSVYNNTTIGDRSLESSSLLFRQAVRMGGFASFFDRRQSTG